MRLFGVVEQQPQPMYNLTVEEAHSFFVGDGDWLVHNANCLPDADETYDIAFGVGDAPNGGLSGFADSFDNTYHWEYWPDRLIRISDDNLTIMNLANRSYLRQYMPTILKRVEMGELNGGGIRFNLDGVRNSAADSVTNAELRVVFESETLMGMTEFYNGAGNPLTPDELASWFANFGF